MSTSTFHPPKSLIILAVVPGIVETGGGLAVPLLTMNMINRFAEGGISFLALFLIALVRIKNLYRNIHTVRSSPCNLLR